MLEEMNPLIEAGAQGLDQGPPEGGQPEVEPQVQDQQVNEAPREFLNVDEIADRFVRVRVDGEDVEVPLKEALSGYSRTADYTRKTQQLAQQAKEAEYALTLQRALQADPEATLQLLSRHMGVSIPQAQQLASEMGGYGEPPEVDPQMRQFDELATKVDSIQSHFAQQQARAQLDQAVGGLKSRYNLDEGTVREVIQKALELRQGPQAFDAIYKQIAFDRAMAQRERHQQRQSAEDQRRQQGAEHLREATHMGGSANGPPEGVQPRDDPNRKMTIQEAYEMSERQLGVST